ncbi:hypothetical protein XH86_33610 [Bradyrhizobium guangdongense]|uniref:Uncharacterized protein n=1 Tax=Bradyrhizobium guangdongense TaxID=1325090 RepID=A0ABX6UQF7_9BRAD|nr:hypothetical protein X265_33575 [Bradyrhizobium guangdongense]QOZ63123.1 hypothetical protein XH86_33610 [Bradyrhizobium guangdongense]
MPRLDRGIQYSAAEVGADNCRRGVLGRPVKPGDDTVIAVTSYQTRSRCAASCRLSCWRNPR